jgi:hypothetical protein
VAVSDKLASQCLAAITADRLQQGFWRALLPQDLTDIELMIRSHPHFNPEMLDEMRNPNKSDEIWNLSYMSRIRPAEGADGTRRKENESLTEEDRTKIVDLAPKWVIKGNNIQRNLYVGIICTRIS